MHHAHKILPGKHVTLSEHLPEADGGLTKEAGEAMLAKLSDELAILQDALHAAGQHSVLIILQGMDTSGKDGAIRKVFRGVNPQGCRVEVFKPPTEEELAHDFLWRIHHVTPRRGMMAVFNRSHYEDVLVARVHSLVPKKLWKTRYDQINAFEQLLTAHGTIILKFFLHISKEEQAKRLLEREKDPTKAWKLSTGDWRDRAFWDDYVAAYEEAISRCNSEAAPWYIVPANRKWYRNLALAETIVHHLQPYREQWMSTLKMMSEERLAELAEYHRHTSNGFETVHAQ
jgi:PPK2 family polyphosphate:nucleotide phosphotransferase